MTATNVNLKFALASAALTFACGERGGPSSEKQDTTRAAAFAVSRQPLGPIPADDSLARPHDTAARRALPPVRLAPNAVANGGAGVPVLC